MTFADLDQLDPTSTGLLISPASMPPKSTSLNVGQPDFFKAESQVIC